MAPLRVLPKISGIGTTDGKRAHQEHCVVDLVDGVVRAEYPELLPDPVVDERLLELHPVLADHGDELGHLNVGDHLQENWHKIKFKKHHVAFLRFLPFIEPLGKASGSYKKIKKREREKERKGLFVPSKKEKEALASNSFPLLRRSNNGHKRTK